LSNLHLSKLPYKSQQKKTILTFKPNRWRIEIMAEVMMERAGAPEQAYIPQVGDLVQVKKTWGSLTPEDVLEVVEVNELFDAQLIKRISPRETVKYGGTRTTNLIPVKWAEINRRFGALIEKAKSMWSIRDIEGWTNRYNDPRQSKENSILDLESLIKTMEKRQPVVEAKYNSYIGSTQLTTGALASPKFLNDERMAQDIFRNIQVSKDEARMLVPKFRAIAEKQIGKEQIESIKETFGIDLEQEAQNLGIDLAKYAIIPAGNRVVLQHKIVVQRKYEIKPPAGYMEENERRRRTKLEAKWALPTMENK
jgi:hypothetical protein